jgi:hypothetical protein
MPTIRIDDEVYTWLQSQARPFEDTPNSVLRRVAVGSTASEARLSGKKLKDKWNIPARQVLYHQDGTFYENLRQFPGALCDPHGYVLFSSEDAYNSCSYLHIGLKLNVPEGIYKIPGYRRCN